MPKAYIIAAEAIKDPAGMAEYARAAAPAITEGPGKVLALDPAPEVLEGDWQGRQTVLMEFESVEAARAWHKSDAYQKVIPMRRAAADTDAVIVSGR
jgi:uncharacterized protein (DUF1330 family)